MPSRPAVSSPRHLVPLVGALAFVAATAWLPADRFSSEATEHLVLGMVVPALVVVARPELLVGAAFGPRTLRRWGRWRPVRLLTAPAFVAVSFLVTPWLLWLTPLRAATAASPALHLVVHLHVVVIGVLFVEHLIGRAPLPRRWAPPLRLLVGAGVLVGHAFLGLVLGGLREPVLNPTLPSSAALADQRMGVQIMWVGGELVMVALLAATLWDWMRREERSTPRSRPDQDDSSRNDRIATSTLG